MSLLVQPYRPGTAYSCQNQYSACLSPIDSIYYNESSTISLLHIQKNIPSPSNLSNIRSPDKNKKIRTRHMRVLSSGQDTRPETRLNTLLRKDLIKKSSPTRHRKISSDQVLRVRDSRCKVINNLMTACSNLGRSKDFHKNIEKEKKILKEWKMKMDQVTTNLLKLADVNQRYIETIYYFNKTSNEEILEDILKIKSRREQNIVTVKKHRRRKAESQDI